MSLDAKQSNTNYKLRKFGPITERRDYSTTKQILNIPDFLSTSRESFEWFKSKGIEEVLREHYPIISANGKITLEYKENSARLEFPKAKEYDAIQDARVKGINYAAKLYAKYRITINDTSEVKDDEVFLGEIPIMTSGGSFIINGSEKVIVSQLIRSPGAYFGRAVRNKQSDDLFNKLEILPRIGSWLEISHKITSKTVDTVKIKIDKNKNVSLTTFLVALGFTIESIYDLFGNSAELEETIRRDKRIDEFPEDHLKNVKNCQEELFRVIRRGDRLTDESVANLISGILFNKKRYSLSQTGRYMLNKKLNLVDRISETILAETLKIKDEDGSEKILEEGTFITHKLALLIQKNFDSGTLSAKVIPGLDANVVYGKILNQSPKLEKMIKYISLNVYPSRKWKDRGKAPVKVIGNDPKSTETHLIISDIVAAISYYFNLLTGIGQDDDPDSLTNKQIVAVGELLQNQLNVVLGKLEKTTRERMGAKEANLITPKNITNNKLISNQMKTFFNSSKLSQFMDQINPLAEISNERRVTSLGPGGLNRDTAQFEVRDVRATHYGRICPIETPEGPNIGLILNFATYAKVNEYGFLQTPYFKVVDGYVHYDKVEYLTATEELGFYIAQSTVAVDENNKIVDPQITMRHNYTYVLGKPEEVDYIEAAPNQMVSVAAGCIPFLENDDANRALMGSNMQRQAVPLLETEAPFVATGLESAIARFSSANITARQAGIVEYVDGAKIKVRDDKGKLETYTLKNFQRSNQDTVVHQRPLVKMGQRVEKGDLLVDGSSFKDGELALGKNVVVAFTTFNGYNYEDAVILNERLVKDDVFTSIHIEEQTIQFRSSRVGDDELTADIPNVSKWATRNLDERGIVKVGSEVLPGDVLVGRVSPKGDDNPTQEEKLLSAVLNQRQMNVKDTSLKVKNGHNGTVIDVEVLDQKKDDVQFEDGIETIVKVSIAVKRKIRVGDKMSGRHGNKGVVSIVLPEEDMPYLEDGTPVDVMLNPQGVPSRMNIGQVLEIHLGMAARSLNIKFVTPAFDGIKKEEIFNLIREANLPESGKQYLINPITGRKFDNPVSVGVMYMLKLNHMVDDKMHARSVGPYSLITQQPLGGKSQNGGQRFGEMETWALESYGATNVLQEILTYKSDDINGRNRLYAALAKGQPLPEPGVPESFNVLSYELKGLKMKLDLMHEAEQEVNYNAQGESDYQQYFENLEMQGGFNE